MRPFKLIAILLSFSVSLGVHPAHADALNPPEPRLRDVPRLNYQGDRVRGLALYTTSVIRLENGELVVLHGFIVGRMNGASNYLLWNSSIDMSCYGRTARQPDSSGLGEYICERDGSVILRDRFAVIAEKYGRMRGSVTASLRGRNGGSLAIGLEWQAREQFPDPARLIAVLQ